MDNNQLIQELMDLGSMDEQGNQYERMIQQAAALRNVKPSEHTTALGAILGGVGDVAQTVGGGLEQNAIMAKQRQLAPQRARAGAQYALDAGDQQLQRQLMLARLLHGMGGEQDEQQQPQFAPTMQPPPSGGTYNL